MQKVKTITKSKSLLDHAIESITNLIDCSYFDTPRVYKDIIKQLKTDAIYSKNIPYRKALKELVITEKLKRKQENHQYSYYNPKNSSTLLNGYGIKDEYFTQFKGGGIHNFFLIQIDLANHTKWFNSKQPDKNQAKKELAIDFTDKLKNEYGFHRLFWAGDGGIFVRTPEATKNYDVMVDVTDTIYDLFKKWQRKYSNLETKLLGIRVSAHVAPIFADEDPGFWFSEDLNNFIKYERRISGGAFAITEQIRKLLTALKQKRFTDPMIPINNDDGVPIMRVFRDSIHK